LSPGSGSVVPASQPVLTPDVRIPAGKAGRGTARMEGEQINRKLQKTKPDYMYRFLVTFLVLSIFISCSKDEEVSPAPVVIPDIINGVITEFNLTPLNITTPDKGEFFISANNTKYKVVFTATAQPQSNAILIFQSDTILTDQSREFTNLGKDAIAYYPVAANQVSISFIDGRKIDGSFDLNTSFGGVFGEAIISQWRDPGDRAKPTQKAKDDIIHLVERYADKDGPGPETAPQYLFVKVSKS
jgi:hypothetical protein